MPQPRYRRRWVKLWTQETLFGTLSQELDPGERWVWMGFLALAGDSPFPGKICMARGIPYTDEQLAGLLNVPIDTLLPAVDKLLKTGRISHNDNVIMICNWERYQGDYERVRQHRQRQKAEIEETPNETPVLGVSNVTQNVTPRTEEEGGGEEEQRKKKNTTSTTNGDAVFLNLLETLQSLPEWTPTEGDREWLTDFIQEFEMTEDHIKGCRDYYSEKSGKLNKGIWKSRLRWWVKRDRQFWESRAAKHSRNTPPPKNFKEHTTEELAESWGQLG